MERYITQLSNKNEVDSRIIAFLNDMKEYNGVGSYLRDAVREKFLREQNKQATIQVATYGNKAAWEYTQELEQQYNEPDLPQEEEDPAEKRKRLLEEAFNRL